MDAEDFETIPSSAEELSISSDGEDEGQNKNVCVWDYNVFIHVLATYFIHFLETFQICTEGETLSCHPKLGLSFFCGIINNNHTINFLI